MSYPIATIDDPTMVKLTGTSMKELVNILKVGEGRAEAIYNALRGKNS